MSRKLVQITSVAIDSKAQLAHGPNLRVFGLDSEGGVWEISPASSFARWERLPDLPDEEPMAFQDPVIG